MQERGGIMITYILIFLYGIIIGSFLNVCIYRIPRQENIVITRSHCMKCGNTLRARDLIPVFSYVFLGGKCRYCKEKVSLQYPLVEVFNGTLWVITFLIVNDPVKSILYCLMISGLLVLSVIDWRTFEIPFGINVYLFILGLIRVMVDGIHYFILLDFALVSGFLLLLFVITKGRGIGGGDIKLMAAVGLILGWKHTIVAFFFGCLYGSVIHIIRMKVSKADHVLAMGPYLSAGIITAVWFGTRILEWYTAGWN